MPLVLALAGFVVVALGLYHFVFARLILSPLAALPNAHPTAAISSLWISWRRRVGTESRSIFAAHQRCGPIVRLGPNEVSVASVDGLRQIYTAGFPKDTWYTFFKNYGVPNLVSTMDFHSHSVQKRMMSNVYSKSYLFNSLDWEKVTDFILFHKLLPVFQDAQKRAEGVEIFGLGRSAGADFASGYLFGLSNASDLIGDLEVRHKWIKTSITNPKEKSPKQDAARESIEEYCMGLCNGALELHKKLSGGADLPATNTRPVVFGKLYSDLRTVQSMAPDQAMRRAASEMLDHMLASLETTGITITYLIYELSLRPQLQAALRKELRTLKHSFVAGETDREVKSSKVGDRAREVDALPLLNAILQETLRLYAVSPAPQPRIVPAGGSTVEGHFIPGGVRISSSAYSMHRNADVFPEPYAFKPERWLVGEKEATEKMRRWFWAFSNGGRMCIGNNLAIHMLKTLAATIYANFTTSIIDDEGIEPKDSFIASPRSERLVIQLHTADEIN